MHRVPGQDELGRVAMTMVATLPATTAPTITQNQGLRSTEPDSVDDGSSARARVSTSGDGGGRGGADSDPKPSDADDGSAGELGGEEAGGEAARGDWSATLS